MNAIKTIDNENTIVPGEDVVEGDCEGVSVGT